jgi:hypothetical protein
LQVIGNNTTCFTQVLAMAIHDLKGGFDAFMGDSKNVITKKQGFLN